jgi:hypothetical protein
MDGTIEVILCAVTKQADIRLNAIAEKLTESDRRKQLREEKI